MSLHCAPGGGDRALVAQRAGDHSLRAEDPVPRWHDPYRDGTTHVIFEPLDFLARLASLVGRHDPRSQAMIRRKHPVVTRQVHSRTRHQFGRTKPTQKEARAAPRHVAMSWAQRLKRVFDIDIETCEHCGGTLKIISVLRTRS